MGRARVQVLVIAYRETPAAEPEYLVLRRADDGRWQGVAGGAEGDEGPLEAAKRELREETGITGEHHWIRLDSFATVPANAFRAWKTWPAGTYVIPEHCFAVDAGDATVVLSREHSEFRWCAFAEATALLAYESNRTALWELNERLTNPFE